MLAARFDLVRGAEEEAYPFAKKEEDDNSEAHSSEA
jgi:hypothetical protein